MINLKNKKLKPLISYKNSLLEKPKILKDNLDKSGINEII